MAGEFRFSFGPWNIHEGADPFGPPVRDTIALAGKLEVYKQLGFDGIQLHDDDAVPDLNNLSPEQITAQAKDLKKTLDDHGLAAEFVAPRLWEDPRTIDGGFTANDPACREYALDRLRRCIDIARSVGTTDIVLWLAREGTYIREAKDPVLATKRIAEAIQMGLDYDSDIRFLVEPKPNEPMDLAYIPTIGHALAIGYLTSEPDRVGCLIESAHAILAGLDPSDEMGFAMAFGKLWSVHLNDQNSLKYDQDKAFGSANLRRAFNQVRVLDLADYGTNGEWIGLDVKAMRTQKADVATKHLSNSREVFLKLVEVNQSLDQTQVDALIAARDYEELDLLIMNALLGD
ncbi:MAG: TIM barrel protein [Lentisphaeria bacterium]|nr:TIM barrel protein [Lentisphaeria bacterium]